MILQKKKKKDVLNVEFYLELVTAFSLASYDFWLTKCIFFINIVLIKSYE